MHNAIKAPHYFEKYLRKEKFYLPLDVREWRGYHTISVYHLLNGKWEMRHALQPNIEEETFVRVWCWLEKKFFYYQIFNIGNNKARLKPLTTELEILQIKQYETGTY